MNRRIEWLLFAVMGIGLAAHFGLHVVEALVRSPSYAFIPITIGLGAFSLANMAAVQGWRRALLLLVIAVPLGWLAEEVGVRTGFPFGPYHYTAVFGPRLGSVPLIIPIAWFVIVHLGTSMADLMIAREPVPVASPWRAAWLALVAAAVVTAFDLPADPFMVFEVKAWIMEREGAYFGEQARGFAGWMLVSFTIGLAFRLSSRLVRHAPLAPHRVVTLALPVIAYAVWGLFFALFGYPQGTRVVAVFAMGIPVMVAASGLWEWARARPVA